MRMVHIAFLALCLPVVNVYAFEGWEHRCVSETALAIALKDVQVEGCDLLPPKPDPCNRDVKAGRSFGDLTRYVDWYQDPARFAKLAPSAEAWDIERRRTRTLKRGWATHNNFTHFQHGAVEAYEQEHRNAIAASANLCKALWHEAMALHYFQDFFAPGHVVTPRMGSNDAVSGSLHDRFNKIGALVHIDDALLPRDLPGVEQLEADAPVSFQGDGRMSSAVRTFLVAVSAMSIREVVDYHYGREPTTQLTLCFNRRSAEPADASKVTAKYSTARGPFASLRLRPGEDPNCQCETDAIARYDFSKEKRLKESFYSIWGFKAAELFAIRGGTRRVTDFGVLLLAEDPKGRLRIRPEDDDECCEDTFRNSLTGGIYLHYTNFEGADYRGQGMHVEYISPYRRAHFAPFFGYRQYRHNARTDKRFEFGMKIGFGLDIVNLILIGERSHTVGSDGHLEPIYAVMPGLEFVISPSWGETALKWIARHLNII